MSAVAEKMALGSIQSTKREMPPRIVIAGTEKVGKSTFATQAPSPIAIPIEGEEGLDGIDVQAFPVATTFNEVRQALVSLHGEHDFKTVVIDSVSTLNPLIVKAAMQRENVDTEAQLGGGYGRQNDTVLLLWNDLLRAFDSLRSMGIGCILIGHVATKNIDDPVNGSFTRYDLDLPRPVAALLKRWCDVTLFATSKMFIKSEDAGFNKQVKTAIGDGSRILHTQARPSHLGGGRGIYGKLPYELELSWDAFDQSVQAARAASN